MSKATLWPTSTVSAAKAWKAGSTSAIGGLAAHHLGADAVEGDRGLGDAAAGIDQLVEALAAQQPAVDDADGADLDDLVAAGRVEAGGLGVEDGVGELVERPVVERAAGVAGGEEVEVVVFRAGSRGGGLGVAAGRERQQEAEEATGRRGRSCSSQSSPPCRSATSRGESGEPPSPSCIGSVCQPAAARRDASSAGPGEVEVRPAAGGGEAQPQGGAGRGPREAAGEEGQRLDQREAVDAEPERVVDRVARRRPAGLGLDPLRGGGDEVGARASPAAASGSAGPARRSAASAASRALIALDLVAHHRLEALALGRRRGRDSRACRARPACWRARRGSPRSAPISRWSRRDWAA